MNWRTSRGPEGGRGLPWPGLGGFTLIEVLTVISVIGLLAAVGAGLAGVANRKAKEAAVTSELNKLVTAIEAYRVDFNQYPPDNALNGVNSDPVLNPLYYELIGTVSSNQGRLYHTSDREETLRTESIQQAFKVQGFVNSAVPPDRAKNYLPNLKGTQRAEVSLGGTATDIELLTVPVAWPAKYATTAPMASRLPTTAPLQQRLVNPWQYVSTRPTNNATSFDLWAEFMIGKERKLIGNWRP
ncbi:MAG TPA: type II secretion system protein [Verrucomicrobiota bacterium]|nr:type II secretion system protein [Verrucomicrobiota bacterium]HNU49763.1 type II secretion system protein [Verrucomicrobiota bacterium]